MAANAVVLEPIARCARARLLVITNRACADETVLQRRKERRRGAALARPWALI
jgi:hypothetical protein